MKGAEAVRQVKEESFRTRDVEEAIEIRNPAGITESEFDTLAVSCAIGGNLDEGRADVDSCSEAGWSGYLRQGKSRSTNATAEVENFVTG
jgi:hypothetical protein